MNAGGYGHVSEQRYEREQQVVGGHERSVAANDAAAAGAEDSGGGVGVEDNGDGGSESKGGVAEILRRLEYERCRGLVGGERGSRRREDVRVTAEFCRKNDDRGKDHDVEHDIFDDGDGGGGAQAARVGVGGQNHKGNNQRHLPMDAERGDDLAHADQLQGNVGHGGEDSGEGKRHREGAAAMAAAGEVGEGYVTVTVTDMP